jgi:hypothetical protein
VIRKPKLKTAIRLFPRVLSKRKVKRNLDDFEGEWVDDEVEGEYPIYCLSHILYVNNNRYICNVKSIYFIPLIVRLAIEFGYFDENDEDDEDDEDDEELRGGLMLATSKGDAVLDCVVANSDDSMRSLRRDHHECVDVLYLNVMRKLRSMGCLKKDDIQYYCLLQKILRHSVFAEKRFRF